MDNNNVQHASEIKKMVRDEFKKVSMHNTNINYQIAYNLIEDVKERLINHINGRLPLTFSHSPNGMIITSSDVYCQTKRFRAFKRSPDGAYDFCVRPYDEDSGWEFIDRYVYDTRSHKPSISVEEILSGMGYKFELEEIDLTGKLFSPYDVQTRTITGNMIAFEGEALYKKYTFPLKQFISIL